MKKLYLLLIIFIILPVFFVGTKSAYANEFEDSIDEQLEKIDFSKLEEYLSSVSIEFDLKNEINQMLKGEYDFEFLNFVNLLFGGVISAIKSNLFTFLSIIVVGLISVFINSIKTNNLSSSVCEILFLVFFISVCLILFSSVRSIFVTTKNTIQNLTKIIEIMSPIIISLLVVAGGNVSAGVYSPAVAYLSSGILGIVLQFLLPMVILTFVLDVVSVCSSHIRLNKFSDFISDLIKWVFGIILFLFGVYVTVQGVVSGVHDGISIKATKYILSSSVPLVGGLLKDGFDLIVGGAILIKNSVGLCGVIILFYTVMPVVIELLAILFMLKFTAGILDSVADQRFSNLCVKTSKFITYLLAFLVIAFLLVTALFIMLIVSSNSLL